MCAPSVGGSNFGELIGALTVFILNDLVPTPIPWLRADSLLLLIVWAFPFYDTPVGGIKYVWLFALVFMPISLAWAAGDVSLAAYIQAYQGCLARRENESEHVPPTTRSDRFPRGYLYNLLVWTQVAHCI